MKSDKKFKFGRTQKEIFCKIIKFYFNNNLEKVDEYSFIAILNLTYKNFRDIRKTVVDLNNKLFFSPFKNNHNSLNKSIGVFPICDAQKDEFGNLIPRFLKKFSRDVLNHDEINIFFRVSINDFKKIKKNDCLLSSNQILKKISFLNTSKIILKIVLNLFKKKFFWLLTFTEKASVFKAIFQYEINYKYFIQIIEKGFIRYEQLYITNFYSPENLGLIKACLYKGLDVIEIQHGVQKNVVAYEYKDIIPSTIKPTQFLTWFNFDKINSKIISISNIHKIKKIERDLINGENINVFISLQPSNTKKFISSLNKLNLERHNVIIRPHPRRCSNNYLAKLKKIINFDFSFDTNTNIVDTILKSDLHLTEYSSCVLDALNIGVPSICFHPIAYDYFNDLIDKEFINVYDSIEDFLKND